MKCESRDKKMRVGKSVRKSRAKNRIKDKREKSIRDKENKRWRFSGADGSIYRLRREYFVAHFVARLSADFSLTWIWSKDDAFIHIRVSH